MRKILAISVLITGSALATLDTSAVNIALPTISSQLQITAEQAVWIAITYQMAMLGSLLPLSALGDQIGHRHVYLLGLILFTVASCVTAWADSLFVLCLARFIQGIGAAGILSVSSALLRIIFPADQMGRVQGFNAFTVAVFFSIGPTLAAFILYIADWRWLFLMNIPLGIIAMVIAYYYLPNNDELSDVGSFNIVNAILMAVMLMSAVYGLAELSHYAPLQYIVLYMAIAIICFFLLIWRERFDHAPLFPTDLLRNRYFSLSTLTSIFSYTAQGIAFIAIPFLLQFKLERSILELGILFTPWPMMNAISAPVAGYLSDKVSSAILCCVGLVLVSLGLVSIIYIHVDATSFDIAWRLALCGIGFGFFQAPNLKALSLGAPKNRMGAASGMIPTARLLGLSIGSAIVSAGLGWHFDDGVLLALWCAALFAILGAVISIMRVKAT